MKKLFEAIKLRFNRIIVSVKNVFCFSIVYIEEVLLKDLEKIQRENEKPKIRISK